MKKFLLTTAAILVLLLVCFAGYVQYQKWSSFKTMIPQNATALIRVNVYGMIQSAAWDYLTSASGTGKKDASSGSSHSSGIELPANLFIYSVAGKAPTTLFTSLAINNEAGFEATLKEQLKDAVQSTANPAFKTMTAANGKVTIAYTKDRAAIALSAQGEEVISVLKAVLLAKNVVSIRQSRFKEMEERDGHLLYDDETNRATMNFKNGAIELDARLSIPGIVADTGSPHLVVDPKYIAIAWLNADITSLIKGKVYNIGTHTLAADSFLKYYRNTTQLAVKGTAIQKETVVTYSYNDDFEKVAQTEIRSANVPDLKLRIAANSGLAGYLQRQGILHKDSNTIVRSFFPLYLLSVSPSADGLQFATGATLAPSEPMTTDPYFAGLNINFDSLESQKLIPAIARYIHPIKRLMLRANRQEKNRINVNVVLLFDDPSKNALLPILEMFK